MAYQDFGGAVIPAMAGFFFRTKAKVKSRDEEITRQLPVVVKKTELSGVTVTGVTKYLATIPAITSVSKYIKKQEKHPVSSVEKYVLRQTIRERNAPPPSSVAKYVAKLEKESPLRQKTGVEKYLTNQDMSSRQMVNLTGVAKYQAEQDLIAKKKAAADMVQRYREQEEAAAQAAKEAAYEAARINDYIQAEIMEKEAPAATRVGRYIQEQDNIQRRKPKTTGVAKYIARKIALDSEKPELSGVAKYLHTQQAGSSKKPLASGVARYLAKHQNTLKKENVVKLPPSGVAKYLSAQSTKESNKPALSKVAKYLEKQAREEIENKKLTLLTHATEEKIEALEGEFIPAVHRDVHATGVARYLARQDAAVDSPHEIETKPLTGVAKYLQKQSGTGSRAANAAPTGVDRYLLRRAS